MNCKNQSEAPATDTYYCDVLGRDVSGAQCRACDGNPSEPKPQPQRKNGRIDYTGCQSCKDKMLEEMKE